MPFSNELVAVLFVAAFFGIIILSRLIANHIAKASSKRIGSITYLVVGALSAYYLISLLLTSESILMSIFFYFWLMLVIVALFMFWRSWRHPSKLTEETEDKAKLKLGK